MNNYLLRCNKILDIYSREPYIMRIVAVQHKILQP